MNSRIFLLGAWSLLLSEAAQGQSAASPYTTGTRYDALGRVTGTIAPDPDGAGPLHYAAVRNTYDGYGRLVLAEKGELSTWQADTVAPSAWTGFTVFSSVASLYDGYGHKTRDTAKGSDGVQYAVTEYSYDAYDRLICSAVRMTPASYGGSTANDACTIVSSTAPNQDRITKKSYDSIDRVTKVTKAYGTSIQIDEATYTYNGNSSLIATLTDARSYMASMSYDGFGRQTVWYFPSPTTTGTSSTTDYEQYGYDANGNRTSLRKRDGSTLMYTFDSLNRVITKVIPTRVDLTAAQTRSVYYGYDLAGRQLTAKFDSFTGADGITSSFDGFGNLISSTISMAAFSKTITGQYDADRNRTQISHPDGQAFTYTYDGLDRLNGLYEGVGTSTPLDTFAFNADQTPSGRTEGPLATPIGTVAYAWDGIARLSAQSDAFPSTAANNVTWSFIRNPASQITSEIRDNDSYAYGGLLNVNRNYSVNGLNQYTAAGSASFSYDADGDLTSDGTTTYVYDVENRLVKATAAGAATSLIYDPMGRLFEVTKGSADTRFLYDGNALIMEFDASGNLTNRYVHGSNTAADDPLVWYVGSGTAAKRFLHGDHLGSILALTNASGPPSINSYDENGIPGVNNTGRFQYTGQAWLPELGMYYYKARIYSPTLGRFLQTDPIGYKDQVNLYEYVGDDPVDRSDPTGLYLCDGNPGECGSVRHALATVRDAVASGNLSKSEMKTLNGILKTWGTEGKQNGVVVSFRTGAEISKMAGRDAVAVTAWSQKFNTAVVFLPHDFGKVYDGEAANPIAGGIHHSDRFSPQVERGNIVAHEGQHAEDQLHAHGFAGTRDPNAERRGYAAGRAVDKAYGDLPARDLYGPDQSSN